MQNNWHIKIQFLAWGFDCSKLCLHPSGLTRPLLCLTVPWSSAPFSTSTTGPQLAVVVPWTTHSFPLSRSLSISTCSRSFPVFHAAKCQQTMLGKGLVLACLDCRLSTWRTRPSYSSNHISKACYAEPRSEDGELWKWPIGLSDKRCRLWLLRQDKWLQEWSF